MSVMNYWYVIFVVCPLIDSTTERAVRRVLVGTVYSMLHIFIFLNFICIRIRNTQLNNRQYR